MKAKQAVQENILAACFYYSKDKAQANNQA